MNIKNKIIDHLLSVVMVEELREACFFIDDLSNFFQKEFLGKCRDIRCRSFAEGILNNGDINYMHILEEFLFRTFR